MWWPFKKREARVEITLNRTNLISFRIIGARVLIRDDETDTIEEHARPGITVFIRSDRFTFWTVNNY